MSILIEQDSDAVALRQGTRRFLLIAVLVVIAIVAAIFVRQGLFRQMATLGFVTDSAQELNKGLAVKVAGFRVGAVDSVTLRPDGKVEVSLEIDANYMKFVTHDAVIELRKEGLIGSSTLEILPGADKAHLAANEAKLNFNRAEGVTAMANQLREQIVPILNDIKAITGTLADPKSGLPATLASVRGTVDSIRELATTGNQQVSTLGAAAERALGKLDDDLSLVGKTLDATNARLPVLLEKSQKIVEHVEKITAAAEISVPPAVRDGGAVLGDVREIVSGAKQVWPVRNLVAAPTAAKLKADSDPRAEGAR